MATGFAAACPPVVAARDGPRRGRDTGQPAAFLCVAQGTAPRRARGRARAHSRRVVAFRSGNRPAARLLPHRERSGRTLLVVPRRARRGRRTLVAAWAR